MHTATGFAERKIKKKSTIMAFGGTEKHYF